MKSTAGSTLESRKRVIGYELLPFSLCGTKDARRIFPRFRGPAGKGTLSQAVNCKASCSFLSFSIFDMTEPPHRTDN